MSTNKPAASLAYSRLRELTRNNVLDELHPALRPHIVAVLDHIAELEKTATARQKLLIETIDVLDGTCTDFETCAAENEVLRNERDELRERLSKLESAKAGRIPTAKECKEHLVSKGMPLALAASAARLIVKFIESRA